MPPIKAIIAGIIFCIFSTCSQVVGQIEEEWSIGTPTRVEIDEEVTGETTIFYSHTLGNATDSIDNATLYVKNFTELYDIELVELVNVTVVDSIITYGLTIDHSLIPTYKDNSTYIEMVSDNSTSFEGSIFAATVVSRSLPFDDGTELLVSSRNTEYEFAFALTETEFTLQATIVANAPNQVNEVLDLEPSVLVCYCAEDSYECDSDDDPKQIQQNTIFEICVIPSEGFEVGNFMLEMTRADDSTINYTPISFGESGYEKDELTQHDLDNLPVIKFKIYAVSLLFENLGSDPSVTVGGTVFLQLSETSSLKELEEEEFFGFDLQLLLVSPEDDSDEGFFEAIFSDVSDLVTGVGDFVRDIFNSILGLFGIQL